MKPSVIFPVGVSPAMGYAAGFLRDAGFSLAHEPDASVTHLLLPVPSMESPGMIKGSICLSDLLRRLPENVTVIGGKLQDPVLSGRNVIDLLEDPGYIARNAAITAHCALRIALNRLPCMPDGEAVLVVGFGRIGKCLAQRLQRAGFRVTVAARKESDRALALALGYCAIDLPVSPKPYRLIFNTVPAPVLDADRFPESCLKIDLASLQGIQGKDVIIARGLPGKDAPESSGKLIAGRVIHYITGKDEIL